MTRATRHTVTGIHRKAFRELRSGNHVFFIYEDTSELNAFVVPFIKNGLATGARCAYIAGELDPAKVTKVLVAGGVDAKRAIERGALVVWRAREYYGLPPFDAARVVEFMRRRGTEAVSRGFAGKRIAAEMTWILQEGLRDDALEKYETLLDEAIDPSHLTMACMYRRDRFHPAVLQRL